MIEYTREDAFREDLALPRFALFYRHEPQGKIYITPLGDDDPPKANNAVQEVLDLGYYPIAVYDLDTMERYKIGVIECNLN